MIYYVAHWDWILLESRGNLIRNIEDKKFASICPIDNFKELKKYYDKTINWNIDREKFFDFKGVYYLNKILNILPENTTLHVFTLKTGIIFSLSYFFTRNKLDIILSITGLGFLFSNNKKSILMRILLRPFIVFLFNSCFKKIIYQNLEDCYQFNKYSKYRNEHCIVESSGIDVSSYIIKKSINKKLKIISASRLLKDKGVIDFFNLSNQLISDDLEFYLAGDVDPGNPQNITSEQLLKIKNSKNLNFIGHIDLKKEISNYDIFISLSKYEGFSRSLLEAAYAGLFVISLQNSGTKFISQFENALLINDLNINTLKTAINSAREKYNYISVKNKEFIEENYSAIKIAKEFNSIYENLN